MDYAELPLPPALDGLVAALWTAAVPAEGEAWIEQEAVPDGCIELIRRHSGRSVWRREQPALFATGLATVTAKLRLGAGARFTGVKLWPWAWHALGGTPCRDFADDWIAVEDPALAALFDGDPVEHLVAAFSGTDATFGKAILASQTVAEIAARTGQTHRQLQRRFEREFGMPPRLYLRLLRFRDALAGIQANGDTLADTAAAQGYADQAHMARDFRILAGLPPSKARRAKGPFV
jgi:AraC-like DNA-binding protein